LTQGNHHLHVAVRDEATGRQHIMGTELRRANATPATATKTARPSADQLEQAVPVSPAPVPAKPLVVGSAADPAEAAADRIADAALSRLRRAGDADGESHQHGPGCEHVARSAAPPSAAASVGFDGGALDTATSDRIASRRGGGSPLPGDVRRRMETGFGRDFSGVRIHTDGAAAELNSAVSARAFTTGNDIFFGRGSYAPHSPEGEQVLAHELAHTVLAPAAPVKRLFGREKLTPEQEQKKKEEKAAKKKAKEDAENELKAKKKTAAENKKLEKGEKADLSKQRKEGDKNREELAGKIAGDSTKTDRGATQGNLEKRFAQRLELEKLVAAEEKKKDPTRSDEEVYDIAYKKVWRDSCPTDLASVRPPRETAAERLASAVREARTEASLDEQAQERGKLGTMLSKAVEEVYEQWELETLRLRKAFPKMDAREADYQAGKTIWGQVPDETKKKRPTDALIERRARAAAHNRLAAGNRLPKEKDTVGDAIEGTEKAATITNGVIGATTLIPSKVLGKIGKDKDKQEQLKELTAQGLPLPTEKTSAEKYTGAFGQANYQLRTGQRKVEPMEASSSEAKASEGMGIAKEIISDLFESISGVMKIVKAVQELREGTVDARKILTLTKASSDGAKTGVSMAKNAADLAKLIDGSVAGGVAAVIPGFSIATSALSMVSSATDVADTGMRVSDNRERLLEARSRTPGAKKVDVMVYPLLHVESTLAKTLEKAIWSTTMAVSNFAASIAEVASGGGFGVPAAYKAATGLINILHSVGHTVADQIIAKLAKDARADAVTRAEGTAETQLQRDPAMVVDGIITRARKNSDPVAIKFLESYGIDAAKLKSGNMGELRSTVLGALGEDADPKYIYESYGEKIKGVIKSVKNVGTKWSETGEMAKDRNTLEGDQSKGRGVGWRLKMMFKGEAKFARSKNKTLAQKEGASEIEVRVGKLVLLKDASKTEQEHFLQEFEKLPDEVIRAASNDKRNSDEWRSALVVLLQDRFLEKQQAKKGKP
jgi:hypothetical protein